MGLTRPRLWPDAADMTIAVPTRPLNLLWSAPSVRTPPASPPTVEDLTAHPRFRDAATMTFELPRCPRPLPTDHPVPGTSPWQSDGRALTRHRHRHDAGIMSVAELLRGLHLEASPTHGLFWDMPAPSVLTSTSSVVTSRPPYAADVARRSLAKHIHANLRGVAAPRGPVPRDDRGAA